MADWNRSMTAGVSVAGAGLLLLIITLCVVCYRKQTRRKPRVEKQYLRSVKLQTLEHKDETVQYVRHSNEYSEEIYRSPKYVNSPKYYRQSGTVYVDPPRPAPYFDPTPNVKVIRQPQQVGKESIFRHDTDRFGTHNVIHVDGVRNVSPRQSRTVSQYSAKHADLPGSMDLYYRIYPEGNAENLRDYDYIPIKVHSGAFQRDSAGARTSMSGGGVFTVNGRTVDGELVINAAALPAEHYRGSRGSQRGSGHYDDFQSEKHSVVQNLSSQPDGTAQHVVSLNVVYDS